MFDGLAWSNDKVIYFFVKTYITCIFHLSIQDFSVMFDGITDIGFDQMNAMGKQSRFRNWKPNWNARDDLKRNQNLYSGLLTELSLVFSLF